ncbi:MAG: DUF1566 domain-containing protein [Burkholderiaceae bacterium]
MSHTRSALAQFALACLVATAAPVAWAKRITLNDTGMTACLARHGHWTTDCAASRQDAAEGRDASDNDPDDGEAGFSFRKVCRSGEMAGEGGCPADPALGSGPNDWGCVYDNVTRLTWEVKTADRGLHDGWTRYTNKGGKARDQPGDAHWLIDATNAEGLCGATNWRLPDAYELLSIVDYGMGEPGRTGPFIDTRYFPNLRWVDWWARNDTVFHDKWAWFVDLTTGRVSTYKRYFRDMTAMLVHGTPGLAAAPPEGPATMARDRFVPRAKGAQIKDTSTGLVWQRCAEGTVWNGQTQTCDGFSKLFTWQEALDHATARSAHGWRMPNIKELFSIVSLEHAYPAIDPVAFPNTDWLYGFASSTLMGSSGETLVHNVYFGAGSVGALELDAWRFRLRLVRRERD